MVAALFLLLLIAPGCNAVKTTAELPGKAARTLTASHKPTVASDPVELQLQLERFADDFTARSAQALEDYAQQVGTPAARLDALQLRLGAGTAMLSVASGPNPNLNLLDIITVATLTRMTIERYWMKTSSGPAFQPWLELSRDLEGNAWELAHGRLSPAHTNELQELIRRWASQNTNIRSAFFVRPNELARIMANSDTKGGGLDDLMDLMKLDPTSGLDPAVREVTRTRLLADRAMFALQRMPTLVRWQTELLADQLTSQPSVQTALANTTRLTDSAERLSRTAAELPQRLSVERQEILAALEAQEGKLRELASQVNLALGSGEKMSGSLNTTLTTFDGLMKRFGVGEAKSARPQTDSTPFNILDYARTAEQISGMAQQLDLLLKDASGTIDAPALDKRIAELNALSRQAAADAKSVLNHAFFLVAGLIGFTFAAAWGYRRSTSG